MPHATALDYPTRMAPEQLDFFAQLEELLPENNRVKGQ
jgi:hypothetical protein